VHESVEDETAPDVGRVARMRRSPLTWYLLSVLSLLAVCAYRMWREPRFFFWDDTQLGAFGQWYGLGTELLSGNLPILNPGAWQGGNYLAEGQWGVWNPVVWLIALLTHTVGGATLAATIVKIAFLVLLCTGAFLLSRAYGAAPWWAALAGLTASLGGQTIYMDAPSWVTGLQNVAVFALVWWALKRHLDGRMSALPYLLLTYILITFGYVFGVLELAALLIGFLVLALVDRDTRTALRTLLLGVYAGLLTVFVYLPGVLTAPVTTRSSNGILNDQFLNMDLGDLATSPITTAVSTVRGYWGDLLPVPLQYVTWLLPVLILVATGWRASLRRLRMPLIVMVFTVALVIGPSVLGPLRYPARMMPYAVLAVAVIIAVVASRGWPARVSRRRALLAVGATGVAGWLAWAAQPASWRWVLLATVLQAVLIGIVFLNGRRRALGAVRAGRSAAAILIVGTLVVLVPQIDEYPTSPLGNFNVPSSVSAMRAVGDDMADGIMTVGDVYSLQAHPEAYRESLLANLWYTTGKDAASVYTVLPYREFAAELCVDLRGWTCPEAIDALFGGEEHPLADEMALNTVVVIKGDGLERAPEVPEGWSLDSGEFTWTLHRDEPVAPAGGVAHTSDGTAVTVTAQSDTSVTLTVDDVPAGGGEVVFSRLAWPGYSTTAGAFAEPERGFLLTLAVDPGMVGATVTVRFAPPGWTIELAAAGLAVLLAVGYLVGGFVRRRRTESVFGEHPHPQL